MATSVQQQQQTGAGKHSNLSPQRQSLIRAVTSPPASNPILVPNARSGATPGAGRVEHSESTTLEAMEAAMCRLSSQHHMSDYNRMKRITSTGIVSQPMVATASNPSSGRYGQQYYAPPPLPPSNRVQQGNARQETMAARSNGSARQDEDSRRQAADTLLHMQSRPLAAKQAGSAPRSTALSRPQPSLEPPPAPKLHRTYTEEEGENPQYHAPAPQSLVGRSPDLSRSLGSGAGSALATPALSMSASSSTSMQDRKASRTSASIPGTPSEGINLSPVQPRTIKDESNDKILSDMLTDAMEDRMLPTSAIPINVNKSQPMAGSAAAHLQGLGIAKSASPASQSLSAIMSRSDTSAAPSLPAYSPALTTGNYDVFHPSLAGVKTSLTHPMNISPLLPPELLPLYGGSIFNAGPTKGADATRSRSPLGKLSVNVDSNGDDTRPPSPTKLARPSSPSKSGGTSASRPTSPVKGSSSSMMSVSRPSTPSVPSVDVAGKPFVVAPSADIHTLIGPNAGPELFKLSLPISQSLAMTSSKEGTLQNGNAGASSGGSPAPARMGNLVLCSCPGKKVRLSDEHLSILGVPEICRPGGAPVDPRGLPGAAVPLPGNNRSPICRDIELDFRRAMTHGDVKVVVCCIDDAELRFLGAAWEEYARVADELGLEVIRLPMAEGFAPANPEQLDAHLSYLVSKYTMHGHNALVHCRGGVGRAGLFACAWMIKMGLLGPVSGIHDPAGRQLDNEMRIVEKVIEVIRKRRSAKAIETPQQVHFILQYIHWLSNHAKVLTGREALELQPVKPDPIPGS